MWFGPPNIRDTDIFKQRQLDDPSILISSDEYFLDRTCIVGMGGKRIWSGTSFSLSLRNLKKRSGRTSWRTRRNLQPVFDWARNQICNRLSTIFRSRTGGSTRLSCLSRWSRWPALCMLTHEDFTSLLREINELSYVLKIFISSK